MTTIIVAVVGVAGVFLGAVTTGALATRAKINDDMRQLRLVAYPPLWKLTSCFSKWPPTPMSYEKLHEFLDSFRVWYYKTGGLYLSKNGLDRYGDAHEVLVACFGTKEGEAVPPPPPGELPEAMYHAVRETVSTLRSALTEDLESRRLRSLLLGINMGRRHRKQKREAKHWLRVVVESEREDRKQSRIARSPEELATR